MSDIVIREASAHDLPRIVELLADDDLGRLREKSTSPIPQYYVDAFNRIAGDDDNLILVACEGETVVGTLQITFTQYLSRKGSLRATIESVRVAHDKRDLGIGSILLKHAINLASARGCSLVQLTTDKTRTNAHRFYEKLGFRPTHEGMKLYLSK
ncbi:GNAT family N-acetyltransferase [Bifidobacterium oedipodis]|uniref:GNAT family acetyltransferase n=1 Tax=Bifidobacterium oedipodis TaxID=2675322 RepID=A0A7Y0HTA2_9BIFI|nr:GNAT family N-acetyltransferase [Bifidobacterium sp. DSM 109957]NMM94398.1 GNAT family acetyltransferase [Bifidobacterium sp. DSM 109957]